MSIEITDERFKHAVNVKELRPNDAFVYNEEFFIVASPLPSQNLDDDEVLALSLNTGKLLIFLHDNILVELIHIECVIKSIKRKLQYD